MSVRDATLDDVEAIRAIYAVHVLEGTASFEIEPPSVDEMRARFESVRVAGLPFLVWDDGEIGGFGYCAPYRPRPAYDWTVEDSLYVARGRERRGIGRALLRALLEQAESRGARQVIAVIGGSDNAGSIALHRALGFEAAGVLRTVGWKHGRWLDSVLMQRALGGGSSTPPE